MTITDKDATFKDIYDGHKDRIYRVCCSYEAETDARKDLFQEVLTNIWRSLDRFRGDSSVSTWIFRITVNTCLNAIRKAVNTEKTRAGFQAETESLHKMNRQTPAGPPRELQANEDIAHLYRCLNRLAAAEKTILSLLLEDLDYREIASILGLTEGNVRVKVHRAKKQLKEIMEGPEGDK